MIRTICIFTALVACWTGGVNYAKLSQCQAPSTIAQCVLPILIALIALSAPSIIGRVSAWKHSQPAIRWQRGDDVWGLPARPANPAAHARQGA